MFGRQAIPMVWDFAEAYPFGKSTGDLSQYTESFCSVLEHLSGCTSGSGTVSQSSATKHPLPDDIADAFITDPPYYDAIPYADLSDFFYVWLRRTLKAIQAPLLDDPLSPKEDEAVTLSHRAAMYRHKDRAFFERMMTAAAAEGRRYTKPDGIGVVVFANKSTSGWEAMLSALVESGWIISASWPIDTEMASRLRAQDSAVLASSVHLVCRPRERGDGSLRGNEVGDWRDVLHELPRRIHEWMPRLAEEGVVGADAIFACLGPALEVFSKYSRVEKANGEAVTLRDYLEQVWAAVSKEALALVFEGADATGFEADARLTAMWLWTVNAGEAANGSDEGGNTDSDSDAEVEAGSKKAKLGGFVLEYDAARKIGQGLGANLEALEHLGEINGETARFGLVPQIETTG
jgi:putative DNA methylase